MPCAQRSSRPVSRERRLAALWFLVCCATLACGGPADPAHEPARNLLLISIDTLRPDGLGCYGNARPTSPTLDALAAAGVLFEDVTATSPWTLPSHASLLTGIYPNRHGLKSHRLRLPAELSTWAEVLEARGVKTAAIVNSHNVGERYGLQRGFRDFEHVQEVVELREPTAVEERALQWIEEHDGSPFFLFLHFYDVHSDYASLPEYEAHFASSSDSHLDGSTKQLLAFRKGLVDIDPDDARHLLDLYEAGIRQMDDGLGRILAALEERDLRRDTLIVVVSDHGEEFLEHGGVLHGRTQYQELLRVPWILAGPGVRAGERVSTPVSLVDVMPTCLALLGLEPPAGLDGLDVSDAWRTDAGAYAGADGRVIFGGADHNNAAGDDVTRSARSGRYKLILDRVTGTSALYDVVADPGERDDISAEHAELAAMLRTQLERYEAHQAQGDSLPALTPEETERLRALGYF
ncbi:MAG: sulfatase family protein [Planctomycetota bacterium]|jgi:arylsulfatase A-like enzyme